MYVILSIYLCHKVGTTPLYFIEIVPKKFEARFQELSVHYLRNLSFFMTTLLLETTFKLDWCTCRYITILS